MPRLHIHLLGDFRLEYADAHVSQITSPRLQALLAFLVLHRETPQARHYLAFQLWPDTSEAQARTNLRQLLHALKQALPDANLFVHADAQTLQWRSDAPFRLDVAEFEQALQAADEAEQHGDLHGVRVALEQAIALYHGDLLPSCYDDWIVPERERLRRAFMVALERLMLLLERENDPRAAIGYAQRLLRQDPLREETYRGLMRLYAACGDRAGVRRVYQSCATVLERELAVEPSAATREAYEHLLTLDVQVQPVLPQPAKTNLPVPLTSFVGREREIAEVHRLLATTRLLTLSGPGGCGKTRLALEAATKLVDDYPHGVWLVELAPLADQTLVAQTMAATLGVREQPGRTLLDALMDYVRAKQVFVILDNCEHLIETCAQLADSLLRAAAGLKLLASSREPFGIAGETSYRVPSLALPDRGQLHDLDALAQNDCVHLFIDRASAAYPPFRLTTKNAPAIVQICLWLDGIPLAIELAAARTKVFPPEQIAARLDDRFRLLTGGSRTALPRHQTLRALIEWSHQLLSEAERVLLRRLAVFAGGWSFEAAQEVCGDGLGDAVLDTLAHLVDKSLVVVEERIEAVEGRYHLLETIRQYARDKLLESGESEQARDRYLEFFLRFAEAAAPNLLGPEQLLWRNRLETEHDNVRAALEWALARNADAALRLAAAMHYLWSGGGYATEGRQWLQQALTAVERADAIEGELARARLAAQAKALTGLGQLAIDQGDNVAARLALEQGSTLARAVGDRRQLAFALCLLAVLNWVVGDVGAARAAAEESLVHARAVADKFMMTMAFSIRALVSAVEGDHESAQAYLEQSAQLAREIGNPFAMAMSSRTLGHSAFTRGHYAEARAHFSESQTLFRALGDKHFVTSTQSELANIARLEGDYAQAVPLYQQTIAAWQELGHRSGIARCLECLAMIAGAQGHAQRAARLFGAAESLRESIGTPPTPEEQIENEQLMLTIRAQLDEAAFNAAWAEGRALTMEQAIADALSLTAE